MAVKKRPRKAPSLNLYDCVKDSDTDSVPVCVMCKKHNSVLVPWPTEKGSSHCIECIRKLFQAKKRIVDAVAMTLDIPKTSSGYKYTDAIQELQNTAKHREGELEILQKWVVEMIRMANTAPLEEAKPKKRKAIKEKRAKKRQMEDMLEAIDTKFMANVEPEPKMETMRAARGLTVQQEAVLDELTNMEVMTVHETGRRRHRRE
jgi:hypothetical protein